MKTYFSDCRNIDDVKEAYRKYAKALHPDNGGDAEEFKKMQAAYTAAYNRYKGVHRKKAAGNTENTKKAAEDTHSDYTDDFSAEAFASIIDKIIGLDGIDIEIVGSWIWLSGNTYPYKDIIKAAGFFWSSKHKKWYYSGDKKKSKRHSKLSFDEVRALHGSHDLKSSWRPKLT